MGQLQSKRRRLAKEETEITYPFDPIVEVLSARKSVWVNRSVSGARVG